MTVPCSVFRFCYARQTMWQRFLASFLPAGRPMGLTFQRAIRALERYCHHAEVTMIGQRLSEAILAFDGCAGDPAEIGNSTSRLTACHFTLEIDPFTKKPMWAPWSPPDGYGPTLMAFLEYTALRVGVVPRPPDASMGPLRSAATLFWSSVPNATAASPATSNYSQVLGSSTFTLLISGTKGEMVGFMDGRRLFVASVGVRVVTAISGKVIGLIGIADAATVVTLNASGSSGAELKQAVKPNEEWSVSSPSGGMQTAQLIRAAPFVKPFKSDDDMGLQHPASHRFPIAMSWRHWQLCTMVVI